MLDDANSSQLKDDNGENFHTITFLPSLICALSCRKFIQATHKSNERFEQPRCGLRHRFRKATSTAPRAVKDFLHSAGETVACVVCYPTFTTSTYAV